jgi:hypothetical protein
LSDRSTDPEVDYYREIERAFVERRGDPLFISNADWVYLSKLAKKGVPRRVVLRGITDAFDAHAHSFARKQKIRSLKFCEPQIDAAVERHQRALHADGPGARGLKPALENLAAALSALDLPPALRDAAGRAASAIARLASERADVTEVEPVLAAGEDDLFGAIAAHVGPDEVGAIEQDVRRATAAFESRMPAGVYVSLVAESVRRRAFQRFSMPRLLLSEIE